MDDWVTFTDTRKEEGKEQKKQTKQESKKDFDTNLLQRSRWLRSNTDFISQVMSILTDFWASSNVFSIAEIWLSLSL